MPSMKMPRKYFEITAQELAKASMYSIFDRPVRIIDEKGFDGENGDTPTVRVVAPSIKVIMPWKGEVENFRSFNYELEAIENISFCGDTSSSEIDVRSENGSIRAESAAAHSFFSAPFGSIAIGSGEKNNFVGAPIQEAVELTARNIYMGDLEGSHCYINAYRSLKMGSTGAKRIGDRQEISAKHAHIREIGPNVDLEVKRSLLCNRLLGRLPEGSEPSSISVGEDMLVAEFYEKGADVVCKGEKHFPQNARPDFSAPNSAFLKAVHA